MQKGDEVLRVRHNEEKKRFELDTETGVAVAEYEERSDGVWVFTHTEVPEAERGRGLGDRLARGALDHARTGQRKIVGQCPFIASWVRRHPEYQDLLAEEN